MAANDFLQQIADAWHLFRTTGRIDGVVRPEVAQSWQRSRKLRLDPLAPRQAVRLDREQLEAVRRDNREFVEAALPFMDFLRSAVRGTGFILVLTERTGIVLEVFGDKKILAMASDYDYVPGSARSEEIAGTNAISLVIVEKKPMQLTGAEHWSARHHSWTCASAPVFLPNGLLLGTVTLSGETTNVHRHTLGMVISAAEAIQNCIREREAATQKQRADALLSSVLTSISESTIAVDGTGVVTHINPTACKLLQTTPGENIGRSLLRLFPNHQELVRLLERGNDRATWEVTTERSGSRIHLMITPYVMYTDDVAQGAILILRERRDYLNTVREISGLNALFQFDDIIGKSPAILHQVELAQVVARKNTRILIQGETGTGKELFAQAIHNCSPRKNGPFVALNCAAIPRELMESEMFGYRNGAFTGASKGGQVGKLELADGGTLFLDEINQMPLDLQAKLLRALQEEMITRLGDGKPIRIDVRVIAAANEDLYVKSRSGEFRQDLYFRLSVVELSLPPLRERTGDIPLLARQLLGKLAHKLERKEPVLSEAAIERLCQYSWPGNVRELENVLELAAILCDGDIIDAAHVSARMRTVCSPEVIGMSTTMSPAPAPAASPVLPMRDVEIGLIREAVHEFNGNIAEAARKLGLSRSTLYRRMQEYGVVKLIKLR